MQFVSGSEKRVPIAPAGDPAFAPLYDRRMFWPVQRARAQVALRDRTLERVALPLERWLFTLWSRGRPSPELMERRGLPRRAVEEALEDDLVLHVDPRALIRSTHWRGYPKRCRPSSSAFIWDGEWDQRRGNLLRSSRYRFISDLDDHRDDLRKTERFRELKARLNAGQPWSSHQQGILLDSEDRILTYLRVYLSFLDDMAVRGFDAGRGKDQLGVAVSREGRLIKINRGLHRLAMAQRLGLPLVPVTVKAVHREWWESVTQGAFGQEALERVRAALVECLPETEPGPLDPVLP
ncbi:hypothetical protein [Halomonas saccharevitans]|uniref:ParB-like nuclease domain-containing protein n=1 Tax=Halomonas saccharevitans TaxID=416872 RepID=A0A1I7B393_9GAMM|nr:hypothetical protein [Halomonas saccharevitans]SFT81686.1 hypothetical protein SAMN04487956_12228 [Halomonas saccharevitans]